MTPDAIKILLSAVTTFSIAFFLAPYFINFATKLELWKKNSKVEALTGGEATITQGIRGGAERQVVRPGGVIIWLSVFIVASLFWLLSEYIPFINKIDFISRNQTWLIIFSAVFTGILGLIDDLSVCGKKLFFVGENGLSFKWRLLIVFLLSIFVAWWFVEKLDVLSFFVPFFGIIYFGDLVWFMIIGALVIMSTTSVIDGIDGLSGGLFAIAFGSYGLIALAQEQINIAAFCFAVVGACTAFLWYNITPAKFYNSETGTLSLATSLTIIAILTDQLFVLPIIAAPLLSGPFSSFLQLFSKKFLARKIFTVAPMHHHFQHTGMPTQSVVMRYWIAGIVFAFFGILFALAGVV